MTGAQDGGTAGSELRAMYDGPPGMSVREIARVTGLPAKTVHRHLQAAGAVFRPAGGQKGTRRAGPLSPAEVDAIAAAYDGSSLDDVARRLGRSGDTIARALRRAGRTVRPRGRTLAAGPLASQDDLARLHGQGLRPSDIAAAVPGASPGKVARQLRGAGLSPHRGRPLPPAAELATAYATAGTIRALAGKLHADEGRIRQALQAAGVPAGSLRLVPPELRPQVAALAAGGAAPSEICAATGLPPGRVARLGRPEGGTPSCEAA